MRTRGGGVASGGSGLNVDFLRCATRSSNEAVLRALWNVDVVGADEVRCGGRSGRGFWRQHQDSLHVRYYNAHGMPNPKEAPQHRHWPHATLVAQVIMVARACPFHGPHCRRSTTDHRLVSRPYDQFSIRTCHYKKRREGDSAL